MQDDKQKKLKEVYNKAISDMEQIVADHKKAMQDILREADEERIEELTAKLKNNNG